MVILELVKSKQVYQFYFTAHPVKTYIEFTDSIVARLFTKLFKSENIRTLLMTVENFPRLAYFTSGRSLFT